MAQYKTGRRSLTNYLDDFLFVTYTRALCNNMMKSFLDLCAKIGIPISKEKTEWADITIIFPGILLDGRFMILAIPNEKKLKAINLLQFMIDKKKATVKELQQLCGFLNFMSRAIYPGRVFTRRMYVTYSELWKQNKSKKGKAKRCNSLKPHHHVKLNSKFKSDCYIWLQFCTDPNLSQIVNRPMLDINMFKTSEEIQFWTDASAAKNLGLVVSMESNGHLVNGNQFSSKFKNPALNFSSYMH